MYPYASHHNQLNYIWEATGHSKAHSLLDTWTLLQFDHLLVSEEAVVVDQSHAVQGLTVGAHGRLGNPASINLHALCLLTHITTEEC